MKIYLSIKEPVDSNFHTFALVSMMHMDILPRLSESQILELVQKLKATGLTPVMNPDVLSPFLEEYIIPPKQLKIIRYPLTIFVTLLLIYLGILSFHLITHSIQNAEEKNAAKYHC